MPIGLLPAMLHLMENLPETLQESLGSITIGQDDGFILRNLVLALKMALASQSIISIADQNVLPK